MERNDPEKARLEELERLVGKKSLGIEILKKINIDLKDRTNLTAELSESGYRIKDIGNAFYLPRNTYYRFIV